MTRPYPEPRPWSLRTHTLLPGEKTVTVVDRDGMPVWWPNLYHTYKQRDAGLSYDSQKRTMSAIVMAFNWAAIQGIDIEARIASFEFLDQAETSRLQSMLRRNVLVQRKGGKAAVGNGYWDARCRAVRNYIRWRAQAATQKLVRPDAEGAPAYQFAMASTRLAEFTDDLLSGIPSNTEFDVFGLDEDQREVLLAAIEPGSDLNPFEAKHQFRNFALILTLYELGSRNGEVRGLKRKDLHLYGDEPTVEIHRRQNDPEDTRSRPSATKTKPRTLPISGPVANVLAKWLTEHRGRPEVYPGAKRNPYVFVSELGRPIAGNTVEAIFVKLREVEGIPSWLTAHRLRHTFNDRFSELVDVLPEHELRSSVEQRMRNFLCGWSKTSQQGEHYRQRSTRAKAGEYLLMLQNLSASGRARS